MSDRFSLSAEFYDLVRPELLVAPEPQYLYAQMVRAAINAELEKVTGIGLALPDRNVTGVGAEYNPFDRDRLMLADPLMTEIFAAKVDLEGGPSGNVRFNRPVYADTTYTAAAREIRVGATISTTPITVTSEQVNLSIQRFAGPYDSTNSRVAPYSIDEMDAKFGVHRLAEIVGTQLRRDHTKTIELLTTGLLDTCTAIYPDGVTDDNTATTKGSFNFSYGLILKTEQTMDEANLPTFGDGYRLLVLTPTQIAQLARDPIFRLEAHEHEQYSSLFPGYIKSIRKFHIFKSTTLTKSSNTSSVKMHYGHAIAPGVLGIGQAGMPRVLAAADDNYGLNPKVIWVDHKALGVLDNRFCYVVKSTESAS